MVAPALLKGDVAPSRTTYYLSIDLGTGNTSQKALTAVFIPENYVAGESVDIILWLMGHHKDAAYPRNLGIDGYLKNYAWFRFREFVNTGRKNVILVAPTLGPDSEAGRLSQGTGLSWYLDQILDFLQRDSGFQDMRPSLGSVVIACHSGGGWPMRAIATSTQPYLANVKEYWGFDCLYNTGDEEAWIKWSSTNGIGKKLIIRYGAGGTDQRSLNLKKLAAKLPNIDVGGTTATSHVDVPSKYWQSFMRAAGFFTDTVIDEPP